MKLPLLAALSSLVLFTPAALQAQASVPQMMADAQTAFIRGDFVTAKSGFETVVKMDPRNTVAINYLRMIKVQEAQAPKGNAMEKQLATVIVPKIEFQEASLGSAIESLRQTVDKASGGKQSVNFVVNLPEDVKMKPVTLKLSNVPFTEVLRYLGELANLNFEYDKYAVKVTQKSAVAAVNPPAQ